MVTPFVIDNDMRFFTEDDLVRYGQQFTSVWSTTWFVISKDDDEK